METSATHAHAAVVPATGDAHSANLHEKQHDQHEPGQVHVHVVPPKVLLGIYGALLVLTVLTVAVTGIDLGPFNIWLALGVAVVKAGLVAMYFMHLRWDAPFNGIILILSLVFVALFIGIAVMDSKEYKVNFEPPQGTPIPNAPSGG